MSTNRVYEIAMLCGWHIAQFESAGGKGESYFEMMYILGTTIELNDEMCHKDRSGNSSDDDD